MVDVFFLFCLCGMNAGNRVHRKNKIALSEAEAQDENGDCHPWVLEDYDGSGSTYTTMRSPPGVGHADYDAPGQSLPSGTLGRYANANLIPVEDSSAMHAWSWDYYNL